MPVLLLSVVLCTQVQVMLEAETYEFGLVDHRGEDEFGSSYTLVECSAMEFLGWKSCRIDRIGV
jgi:hypothetical protein